MKHQTLLRSTLQVLCSTLVLVIIFSLPRSVFAANGIAKVINFQGKVTNATGTNVTDGAYDFVIKIYNGAGSGASTLFTETWSTGALWSSTMSSAPTSGQESLTYSSNTNESTIKVGQILWNTTKKESVVVTSVNTGTNVIGISPTRQTWNTTDTVTNKIYVKDGVFKVAINSLNADLSGVNFNSDSIFMGVEFNGDGEMKPRIQYTATPYAFNAEKVNGLTVTNTSDNPFSSTTTLKIGDGKTVQIDNGLRFTGTDGTQITFPNANDTVVVLDLAQTLTNKTIGSTGLVFSGATTDITTGTNEHLTIIPNGTGRIGLGTTNPLGWLDVHSLNGTISAASVSANTSFASLLVDNILGDLFTASASGQERFTITNSGAIRLSGSVGMSSQCLLGGSTASWGACGIASATYWQLAPLGGAVSPIIDNYDVLVGSTATSSALIRLAGTTGQNSFFNGGNVGIGTTAPNVKFQVNGGSGTISSFFTNSNFVNGSTGSVLSIGQGATTGDTFSSISAFNQGGNNGANLILQLTGGGYVGIGKTNPSTPLDVGGSASTSGNLTLGTGDTTVRTIGTTRKNAFQVGDSNTGDVILAPNGSAAITIKASGSIGIGTTSPNDLLDIEKAQNTRSVVELTNSFAGTSALAGYYAVSNAGTTQLTTTSQTFNTFAGWQNSGVLDTNTPSLWIASSNANGVIKLATGGTNPSNERVRIDSSGNVGIGVTLPTSTLQVLGNSGTTHVASISGNTSSATLVVDNNGLGDLFTASSSGTPRFTIANNGNITATGTLTGLTGLTLASGGITLGGTTGTASDCLKGGATASWGACGTGGTSYFQLAPLGGAVSPIIDNYDILVGSTATTSALIRLAGTSGQASFFNGGNLGIGTTSPYANFHLLGTFGTGATASVSARSSFAGLAVDNTVGDLFTASSSGLARFTIKQNGNVGIGTTSPNNPLAVRIAGSTTSTGIISIGNGSNTAGILGNAGTNGIDFQISAANTSGNIRISTGSNSERIRIESSGNIGIGTTIPNAELHLLGGFGTGATASVSARSSFAGLVVDNTVGDIFTASSSGLARFSLTNAGGIKLGSSFGTGSQCLLGGSTASWGACGTAGTSYFQLAPLGGAISPIIDNYDILVGSTATSSALIRLAGTTGQSSFFNGGNVGIGTTTPKAKLDINGSASISGVLTFAGSSSQIQSSEFNDLTIGGDTTGNILLRPHNSAGAVKIFHADNGAGGLFLTSSEADSTTKTGRIKVNHYLNSEEPVTMLIGSSTSTGNNNINFGGGSSSENAATNLYFWTGETNTTLTGTTRMAIKSTGQVGIGMQQLTPLATFEARSVIGTVPVASFSGKTSFAGLVVDNSGSGDLFTASSSGLSRFTINQNGSVGIGQTVASGVLDIKDQASLAVVGSEKISAAADRNFSSDTGKWTTSGSPAWAINVASSGKAVKDAPGTGVLTLDNTALDSPPASGNVYQVTFDYTTTASSSGSLLPSIGGGIGTSIGLTVSETQTSQTQIIRATNTNPLTFTPTVDWYGTIDNVSVKQVTTSSVGLRIEPSDGTSTPLEFRSGGSSQGGLFIGQYSGSVNASLGFWNTGVGSSSLASNTTGNGNSGFGNSALSKNTIGTSNSAFGSGALVSNTTGSLNTAIGVSALSGNLTGSNNSALGRFALLFNRTGSYNTALGDSALIGNTSGSNNIAVGSNAGSNITTGSNNLILGYNINAPSGTNSNQLNIGNLLFSQGIDGTGSTLSTGNLGIGITNPNAKLQVVGNFGTGATASISARSSFAGLIVDNTVGDLFSASSSGLSRFVITQNGSVGIGMTTPDAKLSLMDESSVSTQGTEKITATADRDFSSSLGHWTGTNWSITGGVLAYSGGTNSVTLTNTALDSAPSVGKTYLITYTVNTITAGSLQLTIGGSASGATFGQTVGTVTAREIVTVFNSTALSLSPNSGWVGSIDDISITELTGSSVALKLISSNGANSPIEFRTGGSDDDNIFIGENVGKVNIDGENLTAIGSGALRSNTSGYFNSAFGKSTLGRNVSGYQNNAFGASALTENISGIQNNAFGFNALSSNQFGNNNTAFGDSTLDANIDGSNNTAFGMLALSSNTSGSNNIALGYQAGDNISTGSNNIIIGYDIDAPSATANNQLNIGNLLFGTGLSGTGSTISNGNIGIGTTSPNAKFQVLGSFGTGATASISARSSFAGLVVDNTVGDLLTASSSGLTRFVVKQNGNMGLGLSNPTAAKFVISDSSQAPGIDMQQISATTGITTNGVDGLQIDIANSGSSANTNSGLTVNITSNNTNSSSNLYGVNIADLVSGGENANEFALNIGTGWDKGIVIASGNNDGTGLVYTGSGRPTKSITLSPEYAGGVLTAFYGAGTDTSITGTMTSDVETSSTNNLRTYYQWTSTQASLNYYSVAVRVRLPKDFSAWPTSNALQIDYYTTSSLSTNNTVDVRVYLESNSTTAVASTIGTFSPSAGFWDTITINGSSLANGSAPDWGTAADQTAVIYLRMGAANSATVRFGDIKLNYLAAF